MGEVKSAARENGLTRENKEKMTHVPGTDRP
jgi:hypothetical protein